MLIVDETRMNLEMKNALSAGFLASSCLPFSAELLGTIALEYWSLV